MGDYCKRSKDLPRLLCADTPTPLQLGSSSALGPRDTAAKLEAESAKLDAERAKHMLVQWRIAAYVTAETRILAAKVLGRTRLLHAQALAQHLYSRGFLQSKPITSKQLGF
jgi:hypothetical protein